MTDEVVLLPAGLRLRGLNHSRLPLQGKLSPKVTDEVVLLPAGLRRGIGIGLGLSVQEVLSAGLTSSVRFAATFPRGEGLVCGPPPKAPSSRELSPKATEGVRPPKGFPSGEAVAAGD